MNKESISLAFNDLDRGGGSDKVYHIKLEGGGDYWSVDIQYGRRGAALMTQTKCEAVPYEKAKKVYDKVKREKMSKGYIEEGTTPEPQVTPTGVKVDIKPPELLEEITNGQGPDKFIASDDYWMQDKSDGVSRGIVKAGGEIFGINKLGNPVPLPAELVAELFLIPFETFQLDAELVGVKLVCRDLLVANEDISGEPYHQRFTRLSFIIGNANFEYVSVVETWQGNAEKMRHLTQSRQERREGVVFMLLPALRKLCKS